MAADGVIRISGESQEKLVSYVESAYQIRDEGWQLRTRFEDADRAYMREADNTEEQRKAKLANKMGDKTKLQNMQVPSVMEDIETGVGFLTNVFLTDYPMFKFLADPDKEDIALQWNTLIGEDQIYFGWNGEFPQAFRNGGKYNFAPIEVEWCKQVKYKSVNGAGGTKLEQMVWEGNRIISHDPYNVLFDPRVPIHKIHEEGEFAGYIKPMTRIQLKRFMANLGDDRLKNDKAAYESADWQVQYYTPQINPAVLPRNNSWDLSFDWSKWAFGAAQNHIRYRNMYTTVVLYCRIMPYDFGIYSPMDQTPDIWKLVVVNGTLVYARPMINAHDLLPMVFVQPQVDNLGVQTKSQSENQEPFQDMINALLNARLASARRRSTDRMLYNPLLVDPDHINSPNSAAKIPLRPTAYGRKMEDAVYQIPFNDAGSEMYVQESQIISQWAMRAQGRNNVSMGQFQKGNKLQDEFSQTMANAGVRDRTQALMWEAYGMSPIKSMLKSNYLQFTPGGTRYNRTEEKSVEIDPIMLRQASAEFEIGDGLLPIQKLANTQVMEYGMNAISQNPAIGAGYDLAPLFSYMMKIQGVDKFSKFEKTPEVIQYERALNAWQSAAAEISKKLPAQATMQEIQTLLTSVLGPMPQPPQQQVPTNKQGLENAVPTT